MGHIHLGVLPQSRKWREVVDLLDAGAIAEDVIAASARAAEREMLDAARSPVVVEAVRLLLMVPHAARQDDFGLALRNLNLAVGSAPSLLEILSASSEVLDATGRDTRDNSDLGELAGRALVATFSDQIGDALPGLFAATPADVQAVAQRLSWRNGIAVLSRAFFARLMADTLSSWLDRTLSAQVGEGRRFADAQSRNKFDQALAQYAQEASAIIQEFSPGWYGKRLYEDGRISTTQAAAFTAVSFKKIVEELKRKRVVHD
ncbi:hypothetical protein LGT41_0010635 [Abyssibius alkaniclasticus]|uniref:hypothetical protein n=1 Tax=Abyssibius alkaniclasticus TaxID=2881234 RepID=UPI0023641719|nr:hypothetical protein [Abyssibius alkaniclasticus]UPH70255.1 hypothetical protein LGT41_0010635 [Abyssibius alkaniclasticus]